MSFATRQAINWTEQGLVPDSVIRGGIRRLLRARLAQLRADDAQHVAETTASFIAEMHAAPIAPLPRKANEQHYELPPEFFAHVLGPNRKYSCCYSDYKCCCCHNCRHSESDYSENNVNRNNNRKANDENN